MEQQEIDRIVAECKKITDEFRAQLKPAVDENGQPRMVKILNILGNIMHEEVQLLEVSGEQVESYIKSIQLICTHEVIKELKKIDFSYEAKIDCSYLYVNTHIKIHGELPYSDFTGTIFDIVDCQDVVFADFVDFKGAIFLHVFFEGARFLESPNFGRTLFKDFADFENVRFSQGGYFKNAIFSVGVLFDNAKFKDIANFKGSILSESSFKDTQFSRRTFFNNSKFIIPPLFHNATLHQDTSFEGTEFIRCSEEEDYRAYRTLKQHMNDVHAKLEENMFFALEQRTRRHLDAQDMRKNWFTVTISWFYDMISGYGQDLIRPILWLVGISLLFAIIFSNANVEMVISNSKDFAWTNTVYQGWGYSFQNLNPLNMLSKDLPFKPTTFFVLILGYVESLLSVAFITLWLLAVRRRFQKGE